MDTQVFIAALLPDGGNWQIEDVQFEEQIGSMSIALRVKGGSAQCPRCQQPSARLHSWYSRTVIDLPLGEWAVALRLHVRRLRCSNADCTQRIFTERLPQMVAPRARRTKRVEKRQQRMTLLVSSSMGERLSKLVGMAGGKDTLLRQVRRVELAVQATPRALGVDDWAKRRGHSYGTLLVNLETHMVVDVLPDGEAQTLSNWLQAHPGVEVISRDRAGAYAEGARLGAPQAQQVADRWHLLNNLGETLAKVFEDYSRELLKLPSGVPDPQPIADGPSLAVPEAGPSVMGEPAEPDQSRHDRRMARYESVQDLHQRGMSLSAIAQILGLDRKTVRKFIQAKTFPERQPRRRVRYKRKLDSVTWNYSCTAGIRLQHGVMWKNLVRNVLSHLCKLDLASHEMRNAPQRSVGPGCQRYGLLLAFLWSPSPLQPRATTFQINYYDLPKRPKQGHTP